MPRRRRRSRFRFRLKWPRPPWAILAAAAVAALSIAAIIALDRDAPPPAAPVQTPPEPPARRWQYIVVHHSASDAGNAATFDQWHRQRGWSGLGYHFVIGNGDGSGDGEIEVGDRWLRQVAGAHTRTHTGRFNSYGIGICLVGNFENGPPTPAQLASLNRLIRALGRKFDIPPDRVLGHNEALARDGERRTTACPGRLLDMTAVRDAADGATRVADAR